MKLIALIKDGAGRLHLDVTRAPDLLRREVALATGGAQLCWCGVPPEGVAAHAVITEVERRLRPRAAGSAPLVAPVHLVIRQLVLVTVVEPALAVHRRRLLGPLRRVRWRLRALRARLAGLGGAR